MNSSSGEMRPLPEDTARVLEQHVRKCYNLGLLLDRYVPWRQGWQLEGEDKREWLKQAAGQFGGLEVDRLVTNFYERWRAIVVAQKALTFEAITDWRMVVGLGGTSVLETAMTLHRVYGLPIIPGSALKGLTRAYAEVSVEPSPGAEELEAVFGSEPGKTPLVAGKVIFFDAVPLKVPQLKLDVINPHYADYYEGKSPPADYLSPRPVYFLTVDERSGFAFALAARETGAREYAVFAEKWLRGGLEELGIGAKTAAGYGYWNNF